MVENQDHQHHAETAYVATAIFFIFFSLTVGGLLLEVTKKIKLPYPFVVFILGIGVGSQFSSIKNQTILGAIQMAQTLSADSMLNLLIPPLIYYAAFTTDIYILKKQIFQIFILSVPTLIISASIIALGLKIFLLYDDNYYTWGFALLFGIVVTCLDTVQVIKQLNDGEAQKKFISLVQGVSLINNCLSIIILVASIKCIKLNSGGPLTIIIDSFKNFFESVIIGITVGLVTVWWVRRVNHNALLTINLTIVSAYITYFIAEDKSFIGDGNGLMAVLSLGLFQSVFTKIRIRTDCEHPLKIFWQYINFAMETLIFIINGLCCGYRIFDQHSQYIHQSDYFKSILLYFIIQVARFISIIAAMPFLNAIGTPFKLSEAFLFTYCGTRGALQLALAFLIFQEPAISMQLSDIFLLQVTGMVILTMLINGTTTSYVIRKCGLSTSNQGIARVRINFMEYMNEQVDNKLQQMKEANIGKEIDWEAVKFFSGQDEMATQIQEKDQKLNKWAQEEEHQKQKQQGNTIEFKFMQLLKLNDNLDQLQNENELNQDEIIETRDRFLMALKQTYWDCYSQNQCGGKAYNLLIESVRWDLDTVQQRMCSWDFIYQLFYSPIYMKILYTLINIPVIGQYASFMLFDWVAKGYEVISTYVKAHEVMEEMLDDFPVNENIIQIIAKESVENRTNAERFIEGYIQVSFPEIIKLIQTKKAAQSCLADQQQYLERKNQMGEIDQPDFIKLKLQLNTFVCQIEDLQPKFANINIYDKLRKVQLFKEFDDRLLKELSQQCKEEIFDKDQCITREGELARYIYIITRGRAIETCQDTFFYTQIKEIGSIVSAHHITLESTLYITQTIADAMVEAVAIDVETLIQLYKKSMYMQQLLWLDSLFALSRFYPKQMMPLSQMNRETIDKIKEYVKFDKLRANQTIQIQAAIILSGRFDTQEQDGEYKPQIAPMILTNVQTIQIKSVVSIFMFDPEKKDEIMNMKQLNVESQKSRFLTEAVKINSNTNRKSFGLSYLMRPSKVGFIDDQKMNQ